MGGHKGHTEIKWRQLLLLAINSTEWQNRYEVWDRFEKLVPPHLAARKVAMYRRAYSLQSFKDTTVGSAIRQAMQVGVIERSVPVVNPGKNIGNYSLRLTAKGMADRKLIKRYKCRDCLYTALTKAIQGAVCGHCGGRHLDLKRV